MKIAKVVVPFPLYNAFDYESIANVVVGSLVKVSFSSVRTVGLVVNVEEKENNNEKLKKIDEVLETVQIKQELVDFIKWVADYNIMPVGLVFKLIFCEKYISPSKEKETISYFSFLDDKNKKITTKQEQVVNFLKANADRSYLFSDIKDFCSLNVLKTLVKNNVIEEKKIKLSQTYHIDVNKIKLNTLSKEQNDIYSKIIDFIDDNKPILLEGATGSGKTEIYFHLFEKILKENDKNQVLFLLPEIALTNQFVNRIKSQFACENVAIWHSNITDGKKQKIWNEIANNNIKIVIGARSALFLPFDKLSLIVVDEEHDGSYKQTENGCYNARDMAIVRAKINRIPIILGSATPALESLINVENKKYNYAFLKNRFGKSIAPTIDIVDLTKEKLQKDRYISQTLLDNIDIELNEKKNQVMLFMNRRGYAPVAICSECGYKFSCPNCSCSLNVHKNYFLCHQCGYKTVKQLNCPACGVENSIIFFGPGVEKIENEMKEHFPDKEIVVITSDTTQNKSKTEEIFNKINNSEIDIIIGTQMITKGYDFPKLTLVGVIDADASLFGANFRSTERTYQLLTQVIGRVGRREELGRAFIQSYTPNNLIIDALKNNDKNTLFNFEKQNRSLINLPPYGKIVMLVISGKDEIKVYRKAREVASILPNNSENIEIFGPTPTTLYKSNNEFRFKIIIKTSLKINIQKIVMSVIDGVKFDSNIKMRIDMNPYFIL